VQPHRQRRDRGKDLQDFRHSSTNPAVAYGHKQLLPAASRDGMAPAAQTGFQRLARFVSGNLWQWLSDYARYRIGPRRPFRGYPDPVRDNGVYRLAGDGADDESPVRVALAGDWGTGTDEANAVAHRIDALKPDYTIHLGDVYFVGDPAEVSENFLGIANPENCYKPCKWPLGSKGTFALNGNHEMYARGIGYFDLVLPAMGLRHGDRQLGQSASFFCLDNAHWRVIGLDTGYNSIGIPFLENLIPPDCALPEPLIAWLRDVVFRENDTRGVVLLSHHQYYSRFDAWYTRQAEQLAAFIQRPVLWFWGHEHRLAVYEKFQTGNGIAAYGRCIGHGGMPVDLPGKVLHDECETVFVDYRSYPNDENLHVGMNGFAQLTFAGPRLQIDYLDLNGETVFAEAWTVDQAGVLAREAETSQGRPNA
jgi:hypothetical protein